MLQAGTTGVLQADNAGVLQADNAGVLEGDTTGVLLEKPASFKNLLVILSDAMCCCHHPSVRYQSRATEVLPPIPTKIVSF